RAVLAQSGAIEATMDSIERLILATQHNAIPQGQDAEIVVYIDLSILGADESRYREYQLQIRREFGWVEEKAFRLGRSHVLQSFLDRPFIYSRPDFRSRLEGKARANLAREMADLA
ncbi:MAG TPA: hypothetical protein VEU06_05510, partial [Micropepsaceae bacterium]|nr:hypothetical protein [Micropepsaceae bacterium]